MKIGILTFHRSHNYGALLQGYALKTHLSDLGHDVEFVDYWPKYHQSQYLLAPKILKNASFLSKLKSYFFFFLTYSEIKKRSLAFEKFMKEMLSLNSVPVCFTEEELSNMSYDCVFYGSDQIWRYFEFDNYKGYNSVYFGDHLPNVRKKISYAASMGSITKVKEFEEFLTSKMNNFSALSVRESNLQESLQNFTSTRITKVLDPVFLLNKMEWISLFNIKTNQNDKYLLFYNLILDQETTSYVERIAKEMGLKIIELRSRVFPVSNKSRFNFSASPVDFITLISNADFIVSSSFHGVAFSIIFKKQFISVGMKGKADRVKNILDLADLSDRYVEDDRLKFNEIDYSKVEKKLAPFIQNSKEFISTSIL